MSGNTTQSLGVVSILWGGVTYYPDKGATCQPGGLMATGAMNGPTFIYSNDYAQAEVNATIPFKAGMSLQAIIAAGPSELQFKTDIGLTYTIDGAIVTNKPKATSGSPGKVQIIWQGPPAQEVKVSS
jgi:hypothetical protein